MDGLDGMVPGGVKYKAAYAAQNARKQTSFKIQFYTGIEVTGFDIQ